MSAAVRAAVAIGSNRTIGDCLAYNLLLADRQHSQRICCHARSAVCSPGSVDGVIEIGLSRICIRESRRRHSLLRIRLADWHRRRCCRTTSMFRHRRAVSDADSVASVVVVVGHHSHRRMLPQNPRQAHCCRIHLCHRCRRSRHFRHHRYYRCHPMTVMRMLTIALSSSAREATMQNEFSAHREDKVRRRKDRAYGFRI